MKYEDFKAKYLVPYNNTYHIFDPEVGYIVWRRGTGGNVEILHLKVWEIKKGNGTQLLKRMVEALKISPPYYSVFVFTRSSNKDARKAYATWGFTLTEIKGLYQDDDTFLGWIPFKELQKL